jgi:hypothetical protein
MTERELEALAPNRVRSAIGMRRYSLGLFAEAATLASKIGVAAAAKEAGMSEATLKHYIRAKRIAAGYRPKRRSAQNEKKKLCCKVFEDLMRAGFSKNKRKCWTEAGRITGVNGRSVEFQVDRGIWKP